ncbi:MAG: hypothetical protein H6887_18905 [Hoeflea sp.]|nr:hypothetical protein [Hoeflea sp.]
MSYYDHASLMTRRLGPWADDVTLDEASRELHRGLYAGRLPRHPAGSMAGRLYARIRLRLRIGPKPAPGTDGDAPLKT